MLLLFQSFGFSFPVVEEVYACLLLFPRITVDRVLSPVWLVSVVVVLLSFVVVGSVVVLVVLIIVVVCHRGGMFNATALFLP